MEIKIKEKTRVDNHWDVAKLFQDILSIENEVDKKKEHLWSLGLNTKNSVEYLELVSLGILNFSPVHPREVFRMAILKAINSIILVHNHPSGDPSPSKEDIEEAKRLVEVGDIIGIKVNDFIIIGDERIYSFAFHGLIEKYHKSERR